MCKICNIVEALTWQIVAPESVIMAHLNLSTC